MEVCEGAVHYRMIQTYSVDSSMFGFGICRNYLFNRTSAFNSHLVYYISTICSFITV